MRYVARSIGLISTTTARGSYLSMLIAVSLALGSCEKSEAPITERLVGVEGADGGALMRFNYESCNLTSIDYVRPLSVNTAPTQYPDPLRDNSNDRKAIRCKYDAGRMTELQIVDLLRGGETRTRTYTATYVANKLTQLLLTDESPRRAGVTPNRDLGFFYDARDRVDSIVYGLYYSAAFTYDDNDNITFAEYRDPDLGKSTKEFYGYAGARGPNPFLNTPLRFVQPYASYWSAQPVVRATFGLREYAHTTEGGLVVESADLTLGDSLAIQRYIYEESPCQ